MKWLIFLLAAAGAAVAGVFYWKRNQESAGPMWEQGQDLASSLTKAAAEKAGEASEKFAATAEEATNQASDIAGEVEEATARPT